MSPPKQLLQLCQRFERNLDDYKQGRYKEAQLRQEFIDPLFGLMGWDMANKKGYAEAYKEVIHEDAIKVGPGTEAPDCCFRIGGVRKFFLEAKKPSIDIKGDVHPAYQLRRYAWSAKLPLSILTDFEELAVYDCRIKPSKTDKPAVARILYLTYKDYPQKWDQLAGIFAPEAIRKGSFDKYVEEKKKKRGTAEVDAAFLEEIERWRDLLARNIALRNPKLSQRELNFATQRTIDRTIFLRICEDRGIEPYTQLMALQNGENAYRRLMELFRRADDRYNSGLFHFEHEDGRPDESIDPITPDLNIDDKVLKEIFKTLYYPDSPYEFSVLPADILGQVYEQFLGKVIRLTPSHRAVVEDKPEVRKAGGVYYTPTYIVDYIVKQTVGKLLEGKKPGPRSAVNKLRILDPACGSGSFLLGAYQYLLNWHRDQYIEDDPKKWSRGRSPRLFKAESGEWKLTIEERKRILMNNIYGVDIDHQAVEVTKLSLLLKVMEDEQSVVRQLSFFRERVLPDLGNNIKCGNSLIGPDFWEGKQIGLLDDEEMLRINAFDWQAEFPEIMKAGGFDAVIGNPPYIRMEGFKDIKHYLKNSYTSHNERSDIYIYFIERGHKLLKDSGLFGMIVSNKFLRSKYGRPFRKFLNQNTKVAQIVDLAGLPVFPDATVRTIILISVRTRRPIPTYYSPPPPTETFQAIASGSISVEEATRDSKYSVDLSGSVQAIWRFVRPNTSNILKKLKAKGQNLADFASGLICMGIKSGLTEAFVITDKTRSTIIKENPKSKEIIKPFLNGRDIRRYSLQPKGLWLIYTYHGVPIEAYPAIERYLQPYKSRLKNRATHQKWYELQQPQYNFSKYLNSPKIIFPDIAKTPRFALDKTGYFGSNTTYFIARDDLYLLGILNSRLGHFYFSTTCAGLEGKTEIYLRFFGQYLAEFPVRIIDLQDLADRAHYDQMILKVEQIVNLHKKLLKVKTPQAKTTLKRQIEATDRQIDHLVYELYGLTEKEIRIVEKSIG